MYRSALAASALLLGSLSIAACGPEAGDDACLEPSGSQVRFDPTLSAGDSAVLSWLAFPFPSDHRHTADGYVDLMDFPNPFGLGDLDHYLEFISNHLEGFSTTSPVYLAFENGVNAGALPTEAMAYIDRDAPLQLVDVSPGSAEYGMRRPLRWEYVAEDGTYVAAGTLVVAPRWGFVLRPQTTYALIVTDEVTDIDGAPLAAPSLLSYLLGQHGVDCVEPAVEESTLSELRASFALLRLWLIGEGIDPEHVVAATVFTTGPTIDELAAIYALVNDVLPTPSWDENEWRSYFQGGDLYLPYLLRQVDLPESNQIAYYEMEGHFVAPNFQRGTLPYTADSGGFVFSPDGLPEVQREESLRFVLSIPATPPRDGPCYPIVEYAHGTHGNAYSYSGRTAARMAARRLAAIGIDQPLHGDRWEHSDSETMVSFYTTNPVNPEAARTIYRQSAADTFSLTRFITESLRVPAEFSPSGEEICFDPGRILYFGHSQGAFTGSLAAAHEEKIDTWLFSGGGGGEAIQFENEGSVNNPSPYLAPLLRTADREQLTSNHPVAMLWQTLNDVNDPLNSAPYFHLLGEHPSNLLLATGTEDVYVPNTQATALALAGAMQLVEPAPIATPEFDALGLPPVPGPVRGNVTDGRTAGFIQWAPDVAGSNVASHFVVFYREQAIDTTMQFLQSAAFDDAAVIERDPALP